MMGRDRTSPDSVVIAEIEMIPLLSGRVDVWTTEEI
jgi:hypothetical protein